MIISRYSKFLALLLSLIMLLPGCSHNKDANHPDICSRALARADTLNGIGKGKDALDSLDADFASLPAPGSYDLYKKYSWKMGYYLEHQLFPQTLIYADSALAALQEHAEDHKVEYAEALFIKGKALVKLNDYNKAFQCFYDAKVFIEKKPDTCIYARFSAALASVLYMQHKYRDATRYMWEDFVYSGHCDSTDFYSALIERQGSLDNIGLCFERLGMYDSAIIMYNMASDFVRANAHRFPGNEAGINSCYAVIYGNMGGVYFKQGKLDSAERLLKENIAINSSFGRENMDARLTMMKLARVYMKQGRFREAFDIVTHIRQKLDREPVVDEEVLWRKLAWNYYDTMGDIANAYRFYKSYTALNDSMDQAARELPGADFNRTFYQLRQEGEIASLKKVNKFKDIYLFGSAIVFIMAFIIVYLVYQNYRQSKVNLNRQTRLNERISHQNKVMQDALSALEHSQQDNTRMMRVVAHDLHNPISAMVSLSDLLNDKEYGEEHNQLVAMLAQSGENALKLINNLLHTTPLVTKEFVQLDELVSQCVALLQFRANNKQQTLVLNTEPVAVMGDMEKLWRVINNLIVNAIKFSYTGKNIYVALKRAGDKALISVRDEGVGISPTMQGEVFNLYAKEGRKGTSGEESFGLGLSISRQIVDAHGGRIWFESGVNKGTTFYVELHALNNTATA